ncbi:Signal transduction histidine kinase [Clostridium cavendishii DSM 21758]|uniref:histidine kinase n=1 Tax=Clostridium cavendishii DSM 21758 TaxID=1121302 RepID=A0A1M6CGQ4_9CLOT|nr:HAMP domain-containing sensor histidine kinase [Clostridium cavendishii]SHI60031.1 Signal transduction histidine kinase [Clostridium cavendishii DSM 21758]
MKKIFKKKIFKLKGEIVIFVIISIALSFFIGIFMAETIKTNRSEGEIQRDREENAKEVVKKLKKNLEKQTLDEHRLNEMLNMNGGNGDLYVLDYKGNVLYGTHRNISSIDISNLKEINIYEVGENYDRKRFRGQGIIKIDDEKYLFYDLMQYAGGGGDLPAVLLILIIAIAIFCILIWGRVSYISKMNKSIKVIAGGNFSERVPLKYRNELRELAEAINFMAVQLEEEDSKKKEFITNISHDLRTPLTTILGYLKTIEEKKYNSIEELNSYLSIINRKSVYLKGLLDDFFDYSKLSSNDVGLNFTNIYAQEILRQIFFEEKDRFSEKELELKLSLSEEAYYINGDGELLERAINNLISNAYKYSKRGTVVQINLKAKNINKLNYVIIEVINIPKQKMSKDEATKIFERLYKIDKSRGVEGSGLGLSITKEIMNLHKGYIKTELKEEALGVSLFIPKFEL